MLSKNPSSLEPNMLYLGTLRRELEKLFSYLKSEPSNLPNAKFNVKQKKNNNFGTKMPC